MTIVVIFGSRSISCLPESAIVSIDRICNQNFKILVGDCYGVDLLVQSYLRSINYKSVTVCWANPKSLTTISPRNNLGFRSIGIVGNYSRRDKWMCDLADYGLAIWDGTSRGSLRNIEQLAPRCRVIQTTKR